MKPKQSLFKTARSRTALLALPKGSKMNVSRSLAVAVLLGLSFGFVHAAPPYDVVAGTGAVGADQGSFSGTSGTISELGIDWTVTAQAPATTGYHVYAGVQTWSFTRNGAPAPVDLEFAISGVDSWLTSGGNTEREAMGLPVGTVCDISNPAYVFPPGALDGTPGTPIFSWTPNNGSGLAVLQYLGGPGGPVNRYLQYAPVPCTYSGSELVLTGKDFPANEAGGTTFWHGLAYLRVLNSPPVQPPAPTAVPTLDIAGLGLLGLLSAGLGALGLRRRKQGQ